MKNILFITYFWPPSGKASLHWPLHIIKYLSEFEMQPIVLTINEDTFSDKDESLLKEIPDNLQVVKTKVFEPFYFYRKFLGKKKNEPLVASETISKENKNLRHRISVWIRMNLFIPDARIGWYYYGVQSGKKILSQNKIDAIISVGPPHSVHLIGKKLSSKNKIPHIPVFIDPWVDIIYYKGFKRSPLTLCIDNSLEKSVIENAAKVIYVTESMKEDYAKKYSWAKDKFSVLRWGYYEEEFSAGKIIEQRRNEKIILHAGNIFDFQNPKKLWKKIKEEINKGNNYKIKFIGTVGPAIKKSIEENRLQPYTEFAGFIPYKKVIEQILNSDYLIVCATEKRHFPGKLYEYLRSGKPILAFGDDNEEVKKVLNDSNAGVLLDYENDGTEFFNNANNFKTNIGYVKSFDRKNIAEQLLVLLKSL